MGLFSFARCVGAAQTVFRCFFREQLSEEVVPYEAADSVRLWEEVSPGSIKGEKSDRSFPKVGEE